MLVAKHNLSILLSPALTCSPNNHLYLTSQSCWKAVTALSSNRDQLMEELNPEYWSIYLCSKWRWETFVMLGQNEWLGTNIIPLAIFTEIVFVLQQPLSWDRECFNEEVGWRDCLVWREKSLCRDRARAACFRCKRIFVSRDQAGKLSWNTMLLEHRGQSSESVHTR